MKKGKSFKYIILNPSVMYIFCKETYLHLGSPLWTKQVCLTLGRSSVVFALCLLMEKKLMTYSDPMVTYSHPKMTYSYPKVT